MLDVMEVVLVVVVAIMSAGAEIIVLVLMVVARLHKVDSMIAVVSVAVQVAAVALATLFVEHQYNTTRLNDCKQTKLPPPRDPNRPNLHINRKIQTNEQR